MTQLTLSVQGEGFLRYLAAPRSFQLDYPRRSSALYGYEGRESYGEAECGLTLLFLVGEDFLTRDQQMLAVRLPDENELVKTMFQVCSLVRFAIESGEHMINVMDIDNEDVIQTYASGVWQVLQRLSRTIIEEMGIEGNPPDRSYDEMFVAVCFALPSSP